MATRHHHDIPIVKLTVATDKKLFPGTAKYITDVVATLDLQERDLLRLESAVFEACTNVIDHAFEPDEKGAFNIEVSLRPGCLVVAVEDRGMPMDVESSQQSEGMGLTAMHAFADTVRFVNLGTKGKRVEMVKDLPVKDVQDYLTPEEKRGVFKGDVAPEGMPSIFRKLRPDEVIEVSRCIYRCYGYTYVDVFYYPEKIRQMLDSGRLLSVVAEDSRGHIVGHVALSLPYPGAKVADMGQGVVSPNYRGKGLLNRLVDTAIEMAREDGLYGFFGEAVTVHPFSQKSLLRLGAGQLGLMLGFIPEGVGNIGIAKDKQPKRQSCLLMYYRLNPEPNRTVYLPRRHAGILRKIYDRLELDRTFVEEADYRPVQEGLDDKAKLDITLQHQLNHANLFVTQFGRDIVDHVRFMLKEACLHNNVCVYLDLPLGNPATALFCDQLESLGFFFSGLVPELRDGDVLRLQYLNNLEIEYDKIVLADDFGSELLDYIKNAHENVAREDLDMTASRVINLKKIRSEE